MPSDPLVEVGMRAAELFGSGLNCAESAVGEALTTSLSERKTIDLPAGTGAWIAL